MSKQHVTDFEELIMRAVINLPDKDSFGMEIKRFLQEKAKRAISYGAMYEALGRLEKRGYVKSWQEEGGEERGNQPKRFYEVTGIGIQVLQEAERVRAEMPIVIPPMGRPAFNHFLQLFTVRECKEAS